jgi:hypothetical protein
MVATLSANSIRAGQTPHLWLLFVGGRRLNHLQPAAQKRNARFFHAVHHPPASQSFKKIISTEF